MPSEAVRRQLYWRAVSALREAETLADLGNVSGPADAPPEKPEDESGWIADWKKRAKDAGRKAYDALVENPTNAVKRRAANIGNKIRKGINAIKKANPSEWAKQKLGALSDLAKGLLFAGHAGTSFGAFIAMALLAWWFLGRKG